jgi:hypothetical protein
MYPPQQEAADCGTFLVVDGVLYGPDLAYWGTTRSTLVGPFVRFTPMEFEPIGTGTVDDPYTVRTVVAEGTTGVTVTQRDYAVWSSNQAVTEIEIKSTGDHHVVLYRAGDCYLAGRNQGYGFVADGSFDPSSEAKNLSQIG